MKYDKNKDRLFVKVDCVCPYCDKEFGIEEKVDNNKKVYSEVDNYES
jgi:hypothetical protein